MLISATTIRELVESKDLQITPFVPANLGPCSIDLRLDKRIWRTRADRPERVDAESTPLHLLADPVEMTTLVMPPKTFVLAQTQEELRLPNWIAGRLEGRSRLARLGIIVHGTAGLFHPGWHGVPVLELANLGPYNVTLHVGQPICAMTFEMVDKECPPYKGHFQDQKSAV